MRKGIRSNFVADLGDEDEAYLEAIADKLREVAKLVEAREVIVVTLTWDTALGEPRP